MKKNTNEVDIALLYQEVNYIKNDIKEIKQNYATKEDLVPIINDLTLIKRIIYGFLSLVASAVVIGWMSFIIRKP
jgi:hypothetical protein